MKTVLLFIIVVQISQQDVTSNSILIFSPFYRPPPPLNDSCHLYCVCTVVFVYNILLCVFDSLILIFILCPFECEWTPIENSTHADKLLYITVSWLFHVYWLARVTSINDCICYFCLFHFVSSNLLLLDVAPTSIKF